MPIFDYISNTGERKGVEADSFESAGGLVSDRATTSGFQRRQGETQPTQPVQPPAVETEPTEPTAGDLYGFRGQEEDDFLDSETERLRRASNRTVNEGQIRRDVMRTYQAEIDAIEQIYGQQLVSAQQEGRGRLGSQRSISARSGTLGSDFGASHKTKVQGFNRGIESSIQAEQNAKISAVMGLGRASASAEIAAEREALQGDRDTYLEFLGTKLERKASNLSNLAATLHTEGVNLQELDPEELQELADSYGASSIEVIGAYENYVNSLETEDGEGILELGQGQRAYRINPETGEYEEVANNPQSFAPSSGSGISNQVIDNERGLFTSFRGEQIVKDYNDVVNKQLSVQRIIDNGTSGPRDLALVFEFMKSLDPSSVVRESEYATAAASGNIFAGVYARFNGYLRPDGGFLPDNVKQEFLAITREKMQVQQLQYDNLKSQYEGIATRQGLNPQNVVVDYQGNLLDGQDLNQTPQVTYTVTDAQSGQKLTGQTLTDEELQDAKNQGYDVTQE